ncbi:MAG TPA: hypothetical protein K8U78_01605 [Aeriscardovia aeriphila]|uniref:Uncharacterized protein n=1 Tax=Aeriscardovia aeriphila TaxID=218139 RepID=A0A921KAZ2_9BIFI|nr:hypothetical protein [Aeriscardovia aeriphila]
MSAPDYQSAFSPASREPAAGSSEPPVRTSPSLQALNGRPAPGSGLRRQWTHSPRDVQAIAVADQRELLLLAQPARFAGHFAGAAGAAGGAGGASAASAPNAASGANPASIATPTPTPTPAPAPASAPARTTAIPQTTVMPNAMQNNLSATQTAEPATTADAGQTQTINSAFYAQPDDDYADADDGYDEKNYADDYSTDADDYDEDNSAPRSPRVISSNVAYQPADDEEEQEGGPYSPEGDYLQAQPYSQPAHYPQQPGPYPQQPQQLQQPEPYAQPQEPQEEPSGLALKLLLAIPFAFLGAVSPAWALIVGTVILWLVTIRGKAAITAMNLRHDHGGISVRSDGVHIALALPWYAVQSFFSVLSPAALWAIILAVVNYIATKLLAIPAIWLSPQMSSVLLTRLARFFALPLISGEVFSVASLIMALTSAGCWLLACTLTSRWSARSRGFQALWASMRFAVSHLAHNSLSDSPKNAESVDPHSRPDHSRMAGILVLVLLLGFAISSVGVATNTQMMDWTPVAMNGADNLEQ